MNKKPRDRILEISKKLFYEQGYRATGINQIISQSNTAKASFYESFPSKDILASKVLRIYQADILKWLRKIKIESDTPDKFIQIFYKELKLKTRKGELFYRGCPISLLSVDFPEREADIRSTLSEMSYDWLYILIKIIKSWEKKKLILQKGNGEKTAKMILISFQGTLSMWNLTQDESYLDILREQLKRIII